jgi:NAD(P)-dependent dehydrogenase (short-subunit alcohol dehydrogenase family)
MSELDGRVAIVTGAAGAIGAATARALVEAGAKVAVADVNAAGAEEVAAELRQRGAEAIAVAVDVSDEAQVAAAVERTVRELGGVDILHNNAALVASEHLMRDGAIHELDLAFWQETMAVNLTGYFLCTKHALPPMLERGAGVIVNTSSVGGLFGDTSRASYGASKAAVVGFTRNIATQYGKRGIRCVAVAPGFAGGEPSEDGHQGADDPRSEPIIQMMRRHHLTPWLGTPQDIANVVVFLASDRARFITGVTIPVDGGLSVHAPQWADELDLLAQLPAGS